MAGAETVRPPPEELSVTLEEVDGSGQTGEATLTAVEGKQTHVLVLIDGEGVSGNQPAHIHKGTCENLGPEPAYGLRRSRTASRTPPSTSRWRR